MPTDEDEWVTLEEAHDGPTPVSYFANKREREEFGPPPKGRGR